MSRATPLGGVIPAQAGIQRLACVHKSLDPGLRRDDAGETQAPAGGQGQ
jgi:hypothetical protein